MAYKVIYKKRFSNKLIKLLEYLEKEWSHQVAVNFLGNLERRLDMIRKQPFVGKASSKSPGIRAILITKHNKIYYKINEDKIVIINMYDTRANPKNNPY